MKKCENFQNTYQGQLWFPHRFYCFNSFQYMCFRHSGSFREFATCETVFFSNFVNILYVQQHNYQLCVYTVRSDFLNIFQETFFHDFFFVYVFLTWIIINSQTLIGFFHACQLSECLDDAKDIKFTNASSLDKNPERLRGSI